MNELMVDGIKYERVEIGEDSEYEMLLFEEREINGYEERMMAVGRSIYDAVEFDSETERRFAADLDTLEDVHLFVKLPPWFTITTPIGEYNPDWAIVKRGGSNVETPDEDGKIYLVRETKSDLDPGKRRPDENVKIDCGAAHFGTLEGVDFAVADDARML